MIDLRTLTLLHFVRIGVQACRNRPLFIVWYLVSLALALNIVTIAIVSLPLPFQRFGLDQPNLAVVRLPYVWLPVVIVPAVIAAHLVVISRWWRGTLPASR